MNKFEKYIRNESEELRDGFVESKKLVKVIINEIRNVEKITKIKKSVNSFIKDIVNGIKNVDFIESIENIEK